MREGVVANIELPRTAADIAEKFVVARRSGTALPVYPGALPQDLDSAYAIQDAAISQFGDSVSGWKVGRIHSPLSEQVGAERLTGPVFSPTVQHANGRNLPGQIFRHGFGAAESEFLIFLGAGIDPTKKAYSLDEAADHIDAVHVGIEIASSPFPGINDLGPLVTISDFGNNNGVIIGNAIPDWRDSGFADWDIETLIDGVEMGRGKAAAFPDGPIGSVRFLLENLAGRGIAVPVGTWVSTGAITGVHSVKIGQQVEARFGARYTVNCSIEAVPVL